MSANGWVNDLLAAIDEYSRTRRTTPVVRVTLVTGESHYIMRVRANAGDMLISLDLYPADVVERHDEQGQPVVETVTRQALAVRPEAIARVDMLDKAPGDLPVGFRRDE